MLSYIITIIATTTTNLDQFDSVNELRPVVVMLRHPCRNRQDVRIKDDVVRIESNFVNEDMVRPSAYLILTI